MKKISSTNCLYIHKNGKSHEKYVFQNNYMFSKKNVFRQQFVKMDYSVFIWVQEKLFITYIHYFSIKGYRSSQERDEGQLNDEALIENVDELHKMENDEDDEFDDETFNDEKPKKRGN